MEFDTGGAGAETLRAVEFFTVAAIQIPFRTICDDDFRPHLLKNLTNTFHITRQTVKTVPALRLLQDFFAYCVVHRSPVVTGIQNQATTKLYFFGKWDVLGGISEWQ